MKARPESLFWLAALVAASTVDGCCLATLLALPDRGGPAGAVLVFHAGLAMYSAAILVAWLSPRTARESFALAAFAMALVFFIPAIGPVGLYAVVRLSSSGADRTEDPWLRLKLDLEALEADPPSRGNSSVAALATVLADLRPENSQRRFGALLRLAHVPRRAGIQLLKTALKDPVEEVRLFAFSRMERIRTELDQALKSFRESLDAASDDATREHMHLRLAETYWEYVYLGLAEGAMLDHALRSAVEQIDASKELGKNVASASFLHGRILLSRLQELDAAKEFERAARLGYPATKVLPYLAECAFRSRDYAGVRSHLRRLEAICHGHAPLARVREYWQ
jgi:tetratricopeptide (TPR) repeat protein